MISKKKIGIVSEKKAAKKVLGATIKGSGSLWYDKGDYETQKIVYQNKFTSSDFYQLKLTELRKAKKDALSKNKDFVFSIQMQDQFFYCFERVLISEEKESSLKLTEVEVHKCINISLLNPHRLLINDKYILVPEDYFNKLGVK